MESRTKIVATLGPASADADVLDRMILAGVDVVRLNLSHGAVEDHIVRLHAVREAEEDEIGLGSLGTGFFRMQVGDGGGEPGETPALH